MLVYRVGHPDRLTRGYPSGPYNGNDEGWRMDLGMAHTNREHPSPWDDAGLGQIYDKEFCGLSSIEGLREWFDGWLERLNQSGYLIHVYDVPDKFVRVGSHQIVAELKKGTLVRTEPCI